MLMKAQRITLHLRADWNQAPEQKGTARTEREGPAILLKALSRCESPPVWHLWLSTPGFTCPGPEQAHKDGHIKVKDGSFGPSTYMHTLPKRDVTKLKAMVCY